MNLFLWRASFLVSVSALAVSVAAVAWGPLAPVVDADGGSRALARGDTDVAIARLEESVTVRPTGRSRYQLASAYLEGGRPGEAAQSLELALAVTVEPEFRRRILHNLALARLREAIEAPPGARTPPLLGSVAFGREALRLDPSAEGTRLNLLLAQRLLFDNPQAYPEKTRDTGGRPVSAQTAGGAGQALTPAQARGLLDALASSEASDIAEVLSRLFGGDPVGSVRGPRW